MKDSPQPHCSSRSSSDLALQLTPETPLTDIGVAEDKALAELVFVPVHLTSDNAEQGLAVDNHLYTILLDNFVELGRLVNVLQVV